jgi:hypothetical protein
MQAAEGLEHHVTAVDDPVKAYRQTELRLREMLLGDGTSTIGLVKGEERRLEVTRLLRRMRDAVEAVVEHDADRATDAEARLADLEEALRELISRPGHGSRAA